MKSLRLTGYEFISPLLACDTEVEISSAEIDQLSSRVSDYIKSEVDAGRLETASVYVRDYNGGYSMNVNPNEKYYPASLSKIPIMIAALKTEQKNPGFLAKIQSFSDSTDYNKGIEIQPIDHLKAGMSYSINDLISKMIRHSDNNATFFLAKQLDMELFTQTFKDLKVTLREDLVTSEDYMTVREFSYFLRVLYNATYLDREYSEKALKLLSQVDYKDGLIAGLPEGTKVSHKFGIQTRTENGVTIRELHDCGLVYKDKPYLVCVMTKNRSKLEDSENVVKNISSMVYNELRN